MNAQNNSKPAAEKLEQASARPAEKSEKIVQPERFRSVERQTSQSETSPPAEQINKTRAAAPRSSRSLPPAVKKDPQLLRIEHVLEQDLYDVFAKMNPAEQSKFKEKGEETAQKIAKLLANSKVRLKQVIRLIADWLKVIPGVNKFFVQQEAKIKAEKIIKFKQ